MGLSRRASRLGLGLAVARDRSATVEAATGGGRERDDGPRRLPLYQCQMKLTMQNRSSRLSVAGFHCHLHLSFLQGAVHAGCGSPGAGRWQCIAVSAFHALPPLSTAGGIRHRRPRLPSSWAFARKGPTPRHRLRWSGPTTRHRILAYKANRPAMPDALSYRSLSCTASWTRCPDLRLAIPARRPTASWALACGGIRYECAW
jgi:hypothetical protein